MSRDAAAEAYFEETASWERDRVREARRTVRIVSWGAALGWIAAMSAAGALWALTPLKTVEPFVVRVDNSTGIVDVVPAVSGAADASEAMTRYFVAHYVQTCERFNFSTAESDYEECAALHAPQRNALWAARWARSNPESPLNVYVDGTTVHAQVKSVSFFERASGARDLAQVRYVLGKRSGEGGSEQLTHWIATLQFAYVEPSADPKTRRWNPLGFKVIEFKPEPETPPDPPPVKQAVNATSTALVTTDGGTP
jgi:type IV secretion system protein VirB8